MLVKISKEDMSTIFRIIDKYDVDDDEIDAIERLTDYDMNREEQENKLTFQQIRKLEKLEDLLYEALQTYIKKNTDYGDSFAKSYEEFGITAPIIRMSDKLERLKTLSNSDAQVKDESKMDTLVDLANYAFMTVIEMDCEDKKPTHIGDKGPKGEPGIVDGIYDVTYGNVEKLEEDSGTLYRQTLNINLKDEVRKILENGYRKTFNGDYDQGDKLNI